jgi:diaminopimelate epimerase
VSNFSKGIPVFIDMLDSINPNVWNIQMTEKHHMHKIDAPSGTAKTLASTIKGKGDIQITSLREGEIYGEHTMNFSTVNEELSITHVAKTRSLFAVGAVEYLGWITEQKPGMYYNNKSEIKFSKYTACGNDFIIVMSENFEMDPKQKVEFVKKVCRRNLDVGADGVIEVGRNGTTLNTINWTYYNKDGNTVRMCGNGARCVGRFVYDNNFIEQNTKNITLINNFNIRQNICFDLNGNVRVEMPEHVLEDNSNNIDTIFGNGSFDSTNILTVGVPHIIHKMDSSKNGPLNEYPLSGLGAQSMMRTEANVNIYVVPDSNNIHIRTYERGVNNETLACGSGCCAVALCEWYSTSQNISKEYTMHVASGDVLTVSITDSGKISLSGPANKVYSGIVLLR